MTTHSFPSRHGEPARTGAANTRHATWALSVLSAVAIGLVALSSQSLWIDELGTWRLTRADSLADWLRVLLAWDNSDAQMPLYHGWIKLWVTLFSDREWSLRASNLPWLALALFAFWRAPVRSGAVGWVRWAGVVCAVHPLTWYYVNEARPYVMLLAASALAGVGLVGMWQESRRAAEARCARHFLIIGLALLAATSPIGAIWTLSFLLPALWLGLRRHGVSLGLERGHVGTVLLCLLVVVPVFAQYVSSFLAGITATTLHEHKLANFVFGFYELLGLGGLGPGREELRAAQGAALRGHALGLGLGALALVGAIAYGLSVMGRPQRWTALAVLLLGLLPVLILYQLAEIKHWRVVGRHMLPLLFFVCLLLAAGLQQAWRAAGTSWSLKLLTGAALVALLASSLSMRFAERHEREMYREAAAAAAETLARGQGVWWFADLPGPEYYGLGAHVQNLVLPVDYHHSARRLVEGLQSRMVEDCSQVRADTLLIMKNLGADMLAGCPAPARVILSRREGFDRNGAAQAWMDAHGMTLRRRFVGFEVWE